MASWDRFTWPLVQWMGQNGNPLTGGKLYFYETGTDTPLDTYSNAARTTPNANPVEAGDTPGAYSNGVWPAIFLKDQDYKVVLKDSDGVTVWTADPVSPVVDDDPTVTSYYDFPVYIGGKPDSGETYPVFNAVRDVTLPSGLTDSLFTINTFPTATLTVTVQKNTASIGTIAFSTLGVASVTFPLDVSFNAGDTFSLLFPDPADSTGADIAFTFVFTVD